MPRFARWIIAIGIASLSLSAGTVDGSVPPPAGETCTESSTILTPFPMVEASASVSSSGQFIEAMAVASLGFSFDVVGPPAIAVPVFFGHKWFPASTPFYSRHRKLLWGDFPVGGSVGFDQECVNASWDSPGFYLGLGSTLPPLLMTGEVVSNGAFLVPNLWNNVTLSATVDVRLFQGLQGVGGPFTAFISSQPMVDPTFPNASQYSIVIAPEPASGVLLGLGLFAVSFMRIWARPRL